MVFHCRCFSFTLQQDEEAIDHQTQSQTQTQTKSSTTETFYSACSDPNRPHKHSSEVSNSVTNRSNLRVFTIAELKAATENFCRASKIGEGGFGAVYKGVITSFEHPFDRIQVAVKLANGFLQGHKEWETEINVLEVIKHPNLVKLIGYCGEDNQLLLVYEYMVNGSVKDHLSAKSETPLSWNMRLKVAQDAARGLTYIHEETDFQIILRDFKPSNILLDDQWNAKLFNFGLAQCHPREERTHVSTMVKGLGTEGYIAPEYFIYGKHTPKSDVWSYGVLLYELITGRRPLEMHRPANEQKLLEWVKPYLGPRRFPRIIDPRLRGTYSRSSAYTLSIIANRCLSENPKVRPKMSEVLEMVNQLILVTSQATGPMSSRVPHVVIDQKKVFAGPSQGENTNEDTKHNDEKGFMNIQLKKTVCLPHIRPLRLLKSCSKRSCCVA